MLPNVVRDDMLHRRPHRTGTRLVSTQKAADTEACFRTYGSDVVQLLMLLNGTTTAPPPVTVTTITEMLTTRATSDTCGAPVTV
jgi:hypothetical protein